ncbi:hypothetical protein HanRHA438_Chr09g0377351 [Helianthus annuus]|nr:hypothetical protein HanHA89_Chr09g0320971 [Helianthus annuus]KAJ0886263.1 hypothetical protein HanRHA438_Chr09g0377351 [Helianthus annuus]
MSDLVDDPEVEEVGGTMPPLKWEEASFEQVVCGHHFAAEWEARYSAKGQTATDGIPISLFTNFFGEGNFRLPATQFFGSLLSYYHIHVSQLSPLGMVRVRHFEFCLHSQGEEPTVDKFYAFYQLQSNPGFFSFATRGSKKLLINPPKSFHDWKGKFFIFVKM